MGSHVPIAIIGGGLGGISLARDLLARGILSTIFERSPPPSEKPRHNYGINLEIESWMPLAGLSELDSLEFKKMTAVDGDQGHLEGQRIAKGVPRINNHSIRVNRCKLESLLSNGLDIRWGHKLRNVEPRSVSKHASRLHFENGQETTAGLVVAADGVHSTVRSILLPEIKPQALPYVVYRGQRFMSKKLFHELVRVPLDTGNFSTLKRDGFMFQLGVDSCDEGEDNLISWFYSRQAHGQDDVLYRPNRAANEAKDIPDEFYEEIKGLLGLNKQPTWEYVSQCELVKKDRVQNLLMRQVIPDAVAMSELANGGIVFIGDAAHATPILGGKGARDVIKDALDLSEVLHMNNIGTKHSPCLAHVGDGCENLDKALIQGLVPNNKYFSEAIQEFYYSRFQDSNGESLWELWVADAKEQLHSFHDTRTVESGSHL